MQCRDGAVALSAQISMDCAADRVTHLSAILESESESSEDEEVATHEALLQQRDEAKEKLSEFEQASRKLLAELSALEAECEIEKSCRQQAEVYAAQVNRENKKLKRISVALQPMLNQLPEDVLSLATEIDSAPDPSRDPAYPYVQQIKDLQEKVSRLLGEKKELVVQVQELESQIRELRDQVKEEQMERYSLQAAMDRSHKALKRYKRVSQMVTQEYSEAMQQLELEQDLRQHAEAFAHKMLVKQKEANRQSMILLQNVGANTQLLQALDEVASLTRMLEEAKQEHQEQVRSLEEQIERRPRQEELDTLRGALAAAETRALQLSKQLEQAEEKNEVLEGKVKLLEEKLETAGDPPSEPDSPEMAPPPPPPPPPPLPPPVSSAPVDPLLAIKQRKRMQPQKPSQSATNDVKARAVEEMMNRIKSGVVLRPAKDVTALSQDHSVASSKRKSTMMELQGILGTMKRPARKPSWHKCSQKISDNQLEAILQRRRKMVDSSTASQPSPLQAEFRKEAPAQGDRETSKGVSMSSAEENASAVQLRERAAHLQQSRRRAFLDGAGDKRAQRETT